MQCRTLARAGRLSVVQNSAVDRADDRFLRCGIGNTTRDRTAIFNEADRYAEFGNAGYELARSVERIYHPHMFLAEPRNIVHAFLREPTLTLAQQVLTQHGIHGAVRLGYGIVPDLVFGLNCARGKTGENHTSRLQCGLDASQNVGISGIQWMSLEWIIYSAGHNMRAPVTSNRAQRMRRNQSMGTRVARCEPISPPGIEPINNDTTRLGSTFPSRK